MSIKRDNQSHQAGYQADLSESTNHADIVQRNFDQNEGPFFSHLAVISNVSLPSIITDRNLMFHQAEGVSPDFGDILYACDGKVVFRHRYVRERFFQFARKVDDINPVIFSMSDVFSLFDHGAFQKIVSFRSLNDMFNRQKIMISVLNFDFQRAISPAVLQDLFGFTPAESRLAVLLINGRSVIECADELGIRISTVREQLSNLFAKTRTSRQPELVSMLSRLDLLL